MDTLKHSDIDSTISRMTEWTSKAVDRCLQGLFEVAEDGDRLKKINQIVSDAYSLSRLAYKQRARFVFSLPVLSAKYETLFDATSMQDIHGNDVPEDQDKPVALVTFPELRKFGDEHGKNVSQLGSCDDLAAPLTGCRSTL